MWLNRWPEKKQAIVIQRETMKIKWPTILYLIIYESNKKPQGNHPLLMGWTVGYNPITGDFHCSHNKLMPQLLSIHIRTINYYCSAYDKDWKLSGHFMNSMTSPLIMYDKFVWPNMVWPDKCSIWAENVWWLAVIINPGLQRCPQSHDNR